MTDHHHRYMKTLIQAPLFQFLLIGTFLFAIYDYLNLGSPDVDDRIIINNNRIDQLIKQFERTNQRLPSNTELQSQIDNYVIEEVLYRQALELGLDKNDPVIRNRLRQKMEFLSTNTSPATTPTDAELKEYLNNNPAQFGIEERFSFEQVFISNTLPPSAIQEQLKQLPQQLEEGTTIKNLPTILPQRLQLIGKSEIDQYFGNDFLEQLKQQPLDHWSTALPSKLGYHFVKVNDFQPGYLPPLTDVRSQVAQQWQYSRYQQLRADMLEKLKDQYIVVLEESEVDSALKTAKRNLP